MITPQTAKEVWRLLDSHESVNAICDPAKHNLTGRQTVVRLKRAKMEFENNESDEKVSEVTDWKEGMVKKVRRWWQEYRKPEKLKYLNDAEVASRLKKRIINPHIIEEQFEERESKWYFGGEDWRLTPSIWLFMVAPSFKLSRPWRKFLESIKNQPAFNRFIKHYDELEAEVDSLISEYTNTAASIAKDDPNFAGQWEQLQDELVVYTEMHCKPSSRELAPSEKKIKRMPMPKFRKYAFKKFKQLIPDLEDKLQDIEKKLQQVCDDLETV